MIYLKWVLLSIVKFALLLTLPFAMWIIPIFTRAEGHNKNIYSWGGWYGTYDNGPEGDEGYVTKRSLFPNEVTGFKGYINRALWMWRNKLYGYNVLAGVKFHEDTKISFVGNPDISDKHKIKGWYYAEVHLNGKLVGFEFYCVLPWSKRRNLRARLGWKILTRKFEQYGFAQLVTTANPFDGYGDD
jgi:hypothetical protein